MNAQIVTIEVKGETIMELLKHIVFHIMTKSLSDDGVQYGVYVKEQHFCTCIDF